MNNKELAIKLANDIFRVGDYPRSPANRIAFMGGSWPDREWSQGGLCQVALEGFIERKLDDYATQHRNHNPTPTPVIPGILYDFSEYRQAASD